MNNPFLEAAYDSYEGIESEFNAWLDESLDPRGPDVLYDLVAELGLAPGGRALDVGCGDGHHSIELARRFALQVLGIDPLPRHVAAAARALSEASNEDARIASAVRFDVGTATAIPADGTSMDLVWCRDVLTLVEDLGAAYAECRRVLKGDGRAIVYQMFLTERMEPLERSWLLPRLGCFEASMQPAYTEAMIEAASLRVERRLVLGADWGAHDQERGGKPGRKLLHAARLLDDPERYIARYGREHYEIALADCLWHVYRMIGKLSGRVYILTPA